MKKFFHQKIILRALVRPHEMLYETTFEVVDEEAHKMFTSKAF